MILLSTAYFPPIEYLAAIAYHCRFIPGSAEAEPAAVYIEACEHYVKQSWRNRCRIYAADGAQNLNYPVCHEDFGKPISEVRIDWKTDWLTRHERAIISAYMTSPYFEYYKDELFSILDSREEMMLEFNTKILKFFLRKCGIPANISYTTQWAPPGETGDGTDICVNLSKTTRLPDGSGIMDVRDEIHPKHPNRILHDLGLDMPYWQVFSQKFGFIPNLSIMDLLFNEGPDSISLLYNGLNQRPY